MQWISAYIGIDENVAADIQLNNSYNTATFVTLSGKNAVAKSRLSDRKILQKHQTPEIDTSRSLTSILTRLETWHFRGRQIQKIGARKYSFCKHCHHTKLNPENLSRSAILEKLQYLSRIHVRISLKITVSRLPMLSVGPCDTPCPGVSYLHPRDLDLLE
ncbi:hypothetical protein TNCV_1887051 [Trichonephila clavipes]|nr:hypothetical protein TNCV_1887051 [Trichonephila clavipes]